jgi:hypothetical protein
MNKYNIKMIYSLPQESTEKAKSNKVLDLIKRKRTETL